MYDAAACGNVNSSQSLRKQLYKSPVRVRFSKKLPDVVLVPIPGDCNFSQQCYRGESDLTRKISSPRHDLSDPVNDEQAILSDIAGGRARAHALRLAAIEWRQEQPFNNYMVARKGCRDGHFTSGSSC